MSRVQKTSFGTKIRTIGQAMRPVERLKTDKQTNKQTDRPDRQTDRGDQYTFRKSKISKSNESRSEIGNTLRN